MRVSPSAVTGAVLPAVGLLQVVPPSVDVRHWYPAIPDSPSVAPPPLTATESTDCHASDPPVTVGTLGPVTSIRAVAAAVPPVGAQLESLPRVSTARNCTSVWPSAVIDTDEPEVGSDQVWPPSVDVWYS